MAITTQKVKKPKINGVYQAYDKDLKINLNNPNQHNVIVLSINNKTNTARVKTITSLEKRYKKKMVFKNNKLNDVRNGNILVIPKKVFRTKKLSGVNHSIKKISLDKLYYKEPGDNTFISKRYVDLINKK